LEHHLPKQRVHHAMSHGGDLVRLLVDIPLEHRRGRAARVKGGPGWASGTRAVTPSRWTGLKGPGGWRFLGWPRAASGQVPKLGCRPNASTTVPWHRHFCGQAR
jgi:hypothetical protein